MKVRLKKSLYNENNLNDAFYSFGTLHYPAILAKLEYNVIGEEFNKFHMKTFLKVQSLKYPETFTDIFFLKEDCEFIED